MRGIICTYKGVNLMDIFAQRIKELRKEKQLSLDMVVYDMKQKYNVEITKSHLSRWESGQVNPTIKNAGHLAIYYGVSLDYLMGFTDSRVPTALLVQAKTKATKGNKK